MTPPSQLCRLHLLLSYVSWSAWLLPLIFLGFLLDFTAPSKVSKVSYHTGSEENVCDASAFVCMPTAMLRPYDHAYPMRLAVVGRLVRLVEKDGASRAVSKISKWL